MPTTPLRPATPGPYAAKRSWELLGLTLEEAKESGFTGNEPITAVVGKDDQPVFSCHDLFEIDPANAAFVVEACNQHASLSSKVAKATQELECIERGLMDLEDVCRRIVKDTGAANLTREKLDWVRTALCNLRWSGPRVPGTPS